MVSSTAGLADEDLLEAALEGRVLLDPLAVLVERGRADHVQLAAGQHRLEHVAGVHRGVAAGAGADHGVQLVDERDDLAAGVLDLLEHGLEPLLELAAVLRAGDHRGQVEAEHPAALERVGHVAGDDALGEPLDDGGLADAGLADQHRVVLGAAATAPGSPGGSRRRGRSPGRACPPRPAWSGRRSTSPAPRTSTPASWLVTRRLPRTAVRPSRSAGLGEPGVGEHLLGRALDAGQRDQQVLGGDVVVLHRRRRGRARRRAPGSARRRRRAAGRSLPLARGSAFIDRLGLARAATRGSTPALVPACAAVPSASRSSATSRWIGSVAVLPAVVAAQLGGLDRRAAAGGELLGPELAHVVLSCVGRCDVARVGRPLPGRHPSHCTTHRKVESIPLNSGDNFIRPRRAR